MACYSIKPLPPGAVLAPPSPFDGAAAGDPDFYEQKGEANRDGTYPRARRGGCYADPGWACRSAFRQRFEPERRHEHIGLRVVAVRP